MSNPDQPLILFITAGTHCDLFWMGTHTECLERGVQIQRHALDLMEQHPDYCYYIETTIFAEYHLRKHPGDEIRMKHLIGRGQLEIGASFVDRVEHAHSGESIIRHAVEGVRWLNETFGKQPRTAAHPDLPGLSPQIPQIYTQAGITCYLHGRGLGTIYKWIAPDGSHILYCNLFGYGEKDLAGFERILKRSDLPTVLLVRGGYSDLCDASDVVLHILAELRSRNPTITAEMASPRCAIPQLQKQELPYLSGEMPFGWGSASSAFVKLMAQSVELEHRLLTMEKLIALAQAQGISLNSVQTGVIARVTGQQRRVCTIFGDAIPSGAELRELWRSELFCQDHNYGGRHGAQSNWDRELMRSRALAETSLWLDSCLTVLAPADHDAVVFNPSSWSRDEVVIMRVDTPETLQATLSDGTMLPYQPTQEGLAIQLSALAPLAIQSIGLARVQPKPISSLLDNHLGGEYLEADVDIVQGRISRLYDRMLGLDLIRQDDKHAFCELVSYKDSGVDVRYSFTGDKESDALTSYQVVRREDGAVFARITMAGEFLNCHIEKEYTIYKRMRRADITLRVWWWGKQGEHLRLCFPFTLNRFLETWYGVPFFAMRWPDMLHGPGTSDQTILDQGTQLPDMLTSEDRRHFREVNGWLDVGYDNFGISVSTRSTCWWIDGPELHASLLRTQASCGDADLWNLNPGYHQWTFRIEPHNGDWKEGKAYRRGEEILNPVSSLWANTTELRCNKSSRLDNATTTPPLVIEPDHVMVTALKPADFTPGALIMRLLECEGRTADVVVHLPFLFREAVAVDLLEQPTSQLAVHGQSVRFALRPYQFKTLKLTLQQ